ncbi:unnamed protein product [Caenorhabditis bovis]|uniref:Uncharacterized protein n=1 Tax=Caenorhabditis bovis TaxID=2654633 RepID=A0A8S1F841_9PELO|nr:unnamed protein product [Caenorhabditis bovis]
MLEMEHARQQPNVDQNLNLGSVEQSPNEERTPTKRHDEGCFSGEEQQKQQIISSLFEEIRLEAALFDGKPAMSPVTQAIAAADKKLKKRKNELALEMTADDVADILGDTSPANFNPNNPFSGPSPSSHTFSEMGSPASQQQQQQQQQQKMSPPLSKYSQNNQGQRNSPQYSQYMSLSSPMHSQIARQGSTPLNSSPPSNNGMGLHSPANSMHTPSPMAMQSPQMPAPHHPLGHHLPHHTRLLQHQQSAPNLRHTDFHGDLPLPHQLVPMPGSRPFDQTLVEEFDMCVRAILMASTRAQCRNVYRQLTAEISELYSRVVKNQVPKKAVKKIVATHAPCTPNERFELERQFKCLSDGLESRRSSQLYESIVNFLYKMRIAIPDS